MSGLYTPDGSLLTNRVASVIPGYDSIKITNRLLDGSFHIQTIGVGARICKASFFASESAKDTIDIYESTGTPVKVTGSGKYYTGIIKNAPEWERLAPGLYKTSITLLVSEEGTA